MSNFDINHDRRRGPYTGYHSNYECKKEPEYLLGKGAFGEVYKGLHKRTLTVVAIKFCKSISNNQTFLRETEILTRLKHDNIVECYSIEPDLTNPNKIMIVMELCTGTLRDYLLEDDNFDGLSHEEFLIVFKDITKGLKYLKSENIVHRDLKPENIMRVVGNKLVIYKLADFGAARELHNGETFNTICGTAYFLHPNIYRCHLNQDGKEFGENVDLWALAATLYNVATNKLPFRPCSLAGEIFKPNMEGVIAFSYNQSQPIQILPARCKLHPNLKRLIEDFIAILLRINLSDPEGYNTFYKKTDEILKWKTMRVFNVNNMEIIKVFTKPDEFETNFEKQFKEMFPEQSENVPKMNDGNGISCTLCDNNYESEYHYIFIFRPLKYYTSQQTQKIFVGDETKIRLIIKFAAYFIRKLKKKMEGISFLITSHDDVLKEIPAINKTPKCLHNAIDKLSKTFSFKCDDINEWLKKASELYCKMSKLKQTVNCFIHLNMKSKKEIPGEILNKIRENLSEPRDIGSAQNLIESNNQLLLDNDELISELHLQLQ